MKNDYWKKTPANCHVIETNAMFPYFHLKVSKYRTSGQLWCRSSQATRRHEFNVPQINKLHHGGQHVIQLVESDAPRLTQENVPLNRFLGHWHAELLGTEESEQVVGIYYRKGNQN